MAGPRAGTAVVTGGGNGLGAAIARRLAERGLAVVVGDVDEAAATRTAARIGGRAVRLDVADAAACRALVAELDDLVAWVNNAGILHTGPAWAIGDEQRRRLVDVNVHGVMNGTLAALPQLRARGAGHVVNVVSLAGLHPAPGETVYGATKHAALGFSVATHLDLLARGERGVHVSALCPDGIWTPMLFERTADPDAWPSWSGVMLDPDRVAAAAVDLLDRPRPLRAVPRWRGAMLRAAATTPRLVGRVLPTMIRVARSRQRTWGRRHGGRS
jgi:short-subunit dehydrogenase